MRSGRGAGGEGLLVLLLLLTLGCATPAPGPTTAPEAVEGSAAAITGQVMVTYKPAPPVLWSRTTLELEQTYRLRTVFAWTMASLGEQCVVFEIPRDRSQDEILRRLRADPRVGSAQAIATFDALTDAQVHTAYNDPYAHLQRSIQVLTLEKAHRWATGKGVRVAVIDTGVDVDHPDLRGRIAKVGNFVERGEQGFTSDIHGTAVAGVIAAATNNQVGIVGVAPQAEIFALKACWPKRPGTREAVCDSYTLARAIDFAIVQGAQILNFSLAGPHDPLLARLIGAAIERGIVVVAADAGDGRRSFPAGLQGVIGVLGLDQTGVPPSQASATALRAPSADILTTVPQGSYDFFSGSSLAAAQVTGIAALLLEREPHLAPARLADLLRRTARASGAALAQVDACAALAGALGQGGCG
jgi:subtilisin family serine protease